MIQDSARHKRSTESSGHNSRLQIPATAGLAILMVYLAWLVLNPGGPVTPAASSQAGPILQDSCMEPAFYEVDRVVDGDTFIAIVDGSRERIRLIGIDTPENALTTASGTRPSESGSFEATLRLEELLGGKSVMLEKDVSERDSYGRLLRYVWLDAHTCVNLVLVEEGLASVVHIPPDTAMLDALRQAEKKAQQAGLGIWSGK